MYTVHLRSVALPDPAVHPPNEEHALQTAAISYRVADFLKQHPPFQGMEEPDLLSLVARGRVKFHEIDEFLCWQNAGYVPFVFVIQQGAVSLWESANGKELLRDIRGPGDMVGLERFLGSESYPYSAKANSDVVVYALPAADFEPLLAKYPQAGRYVESYAAAGAVYRETQQEYVHQRYVVELASHPEPLSCSPGATIVDAARAMRTANASAIAVMRDHTLLGVLSASDIVAWVAQGQDASRKVSELMSAPPPAIAPQASIADCVLSIANAEAGFAALTADGTQQGGLLRLLSTEDLQPAFGDNPLTILRDIAHAMSLEAVRLQHLRARAFLLGQLTEPAAIDWLASFADRINIAVGSRLTELAGIAQPDWSWCFWGAAGRCELLTPVEPQIALICRDRVDIRAREAFERLRADFAACGYLPYVAPEWGGDTLCATLATWQDRFAEWIRDPILSEMYTARQLFDLRPAFGGVDWWPRLEQSVRGAIEPSFQKLLANDCLAALPPLTFFQDAVVDESGERSEVFALEQRALNPIVEVGRVFALSHDRVLGSSTLERLETARSRFPAQERVFREAIETLRVLLYLQARGGLRLRDSGAEILPSQLSRLDRQALKSGFRSIHNLLEFTIKQLWVKLR